jgi:hypothetical protein
MKKYLYTISALSTLFIHHASALENATCKVCHPKIYSEYQRSIHANSSIYKDALHKVIWDKHPSKAKGDYSCAKCHTPSDHDLVAGKSQLSDNPIQQTEPISCQACHQIESIEKHTKANKNIYTDKKKYFFSADKAKKGQKVIFKEESSFFGLITKTSGSPHHDIDYSNEGFYTGESCMGCHAHKKGSNGFAICDLEVKQGDSKESCISCHMPQVSGSKAQQQHTSTHAFHGSSIRNGTPTHLSSSIALSLEKREQGFVITVQNKATHTLFIHSLRLGELRVAIERAGKTITLDSTPFHRVIGKEGKPTMPWLADSVLKDTTIKAHEKREVTYQEQLQKGDTVVLELGYHVINPKMAQKLGIEDDTLHEFISLSKKRIEIE